jgi:hypothetical protein
MSDFIKRAKAFNKALSTLEDMFEVSIVTGYSTPGDDENYLMVSDWKDKGKTFVKLCNLDDMEEEEEDDNE